MIKRTIFCLLLAIAFLFAGCTNEKKPNASETGTPDRSSVQTASAFSTNPPTLPDIPTLPEPSTLPEPPTDSSDEADALYPNQPKDGYTKRY